MCRLHRAGTEVRGVRGAQPYLAQCIMTSSELAATAQALHQAKIIFRSSFEVTEEG